MAEAITVRVRAFAGVREALGTGDTTLQIEPGLDVAGLLAHLEASHPGVHLSDRRFAIAVNRSYATLGTQLADGDEIALIPPVSGGSEQAPAARLFEVTEKPLSLDEVGLATARSRPGRHHRFRRHRARDHAGRRWVYMESSLPTISNMKPILRWRSWCWRRSARKLKRAGRISAPWQSYTGSAGWRSARPRWSSQRQPRTGRTHLPPANTPSIV